MSFKNRTISIAVSKETLLWWQHQAVLQGIKLSQLVGEVLQRKRNEIQNGNLHTEKNIDTK